MNESAVDPMAVTGFSRRVKSMHDWWCTMTFAPPGPTSQAVYSRSRCYMSQARLASLEGVYCYFVIATTRDISCSDKMP